MEGGSNQAPAEEEVRASSRRRQLQNECSVRFTMRVCVWVGEGDDSCGRQRTRMIRRRRGVQEQRSRGSI